MPTVNYHQTLERVIPVEVTEEELRVLRSREDDDDAARAVAQQRVVDEAVAHQHEYPAEFSLAIVLDENEEELFEV